MQELEREYTRASYVVDAPDGSFVLRVGEPSARLDALLGTLDVSRWAFITAHNPRSDIRSAEENSRRHGELVEMVRSRGFRALPSAGIDDDAAWPTERGLLVLDIQRDAAIMLGRELEQNAILYGVRGSAPELVYCDRPS